MTPSHVPYTDFRHTTACRKSRSRIDWARVGMVVGSLIASWAAVIAVAAIFVGAWSLLRSGW